MRALDREVKEKLNMTLRGLHGANANREPVLVYKRYVDDITVPIRIPKGTSNQALKDCINEALISLPKPHLKFTVQVVRQGEKGTALDLQLCVQEDGSVQRQFYMKPIAEVKDNANIAEETFRRLRNTSTGQEDQTRILEEYMSRLKFIGVHEERIRRDVAKGIQKYVRLKNQGDLIRNNETRASVRRRNKKEKQQWTDQNGLLRPLLITEEGLKFAAQRRMKKAQREDLMSAQPGKPFVVERYARREYEIMGPKNQVDLHCRQGTAKELCMKKVGGECQGQCIMRSVVYELKCMKCEAVYIGETSRALSQRLAEHEKDYRDKKDTSWAWHHLRSEHRGTQSTFGRDFTLVKCTKASSAFRRQLLEEVMITRRRRASDGTILNDHLEFNTARDLLEENRIN